MPRNRPRKTDRGTKDLLLYEQAYEEILKGRSVRASAEMFDLCHVSLLRYQKKEKTLLMKLQWATDQPQKFFQRNRRRPWSNIL